MVQYSETTMKYALKPLSVGGILDQSILIFKDNFSFFVKLMLCLQLPVAVATQIYLTETMPVLSAHPTPEELSAFTQTQLSWLLTFVIPLSLLLEIFITPFTFGVLVHAASRIYLGQSVDIRRSFRAMIGRAVPLFWTWLLFHFFFYSGLALCVLPGILVLFWFALATTIAMLERTSGIAALRRSWYLMRSAGIEHYWQYFRLGVVIFLIQAGIGGGAAVILERHLAAVAGGILQTLGVGFATIASVVFYYSCRCRIENFDIVQMARAVAAEPTEPLRTLEQG
jgi:hypothetical protein